jgi:hypothetical protein
MSPVSKSLISGTFACALALAGCSSDDGGSGGTGAGAMGGAAGATGGAAGTNPMAGAGGTNPQGGAGGMNPAGGMSGGASGVGGVVGGMSGGTSGVGGVEVMCESTNDIQSGAMCADAASGFFAIKSVIDVWWKDDADPPLVDPGRGPITVYLMGELKDVCPDGTGGLGIIKGCGVELPVFMSDANCDAFQITFPDDLWDKPGMPTFTTTGSTTGFNPNDILTLNIATGLVGIDLTDQNGAWPASADDVTCAAGAVDQCFPDHDGDGKPGITVKMGKVGENLTANGCGGFDLPFVHRGAPLDVLGAIVDEGIKAETLYIGVRTRIGGSGAINADCASGVGDSQAEFVDSRVVGCTKKEPGDGMPESDCAITDAQFVDSSAPIYNVIAKGNAPPTDVLKPATQGGGPLDQTPSAGPRSALVRLGDAGGTFTCADVRAAAFPAL